VTVSSTRWPSSKWRHSSSVTAGGTSPATIASVNASAARSAGLNASEVRHISSSATS
jgi:hypothetical protein